MMAEECPMAQVLMDGWREFSLSREQFRQIAEDFSVAMGDGLNGRPSSLQMLPAFVSRPSGKEKGLYLALDFGGTNLRVAEIELCGQGNTQIRKIHKASLKNTDGARDYTSATVNVDELFDFIACQVAGVANGTDQFLGHSFSYASRQSSLSKANFVGWTKEIKVAGLEGQDINGLLSAALERQHVGKVHPVAVINDTTATLLAAAYSLPEADIGSVCGTGHNSCYYESHFRYGETDGVMAFNAESGGFDRLCFSRVDEQLDAESESPGQQRLEKMVSGRYLGELTRRMLLLGRGACGMQFVEESPTLQRMDGISSIDVAAFVGDETIDLEKINSWIEKKLQGKSVTLAERHFIKAVAEMVVGRSATLVAATYAGFLLRMDPQRKKKHVVGINGSLYEKMPGFADGVQAALEKLGDWGPDKVSFHIVEEAPLIGASIAAAMSKAGEVS